MLRRAQLCTGNTVAAVIRNGYRDMRGVEVSCRADEHKKAAKETTTAHAKEKRGGRGGGQQPYTRVPLVGLLLPFHGVKKNY